MLTRPTTSSASDDWVSGGGAVVGGAVVAGGAVVDATVVVVVVGGAVVVVAGSLVGVVVVLGRPRAPEPSPEEPSRPGVAASTDFVSGWPPEPWDAARSAADPVSCTSSSDAVPTREWTNTGPRQATSTNATSRGTDGCRR
jgi:hypothetical protein